MVCCWGIRAPQRPTGGASGSTGIVMWAGGGDDAASRKTQRLIETTKEPTGGGPDDQHLKPWTIITVNALQTKTNVLRGGRLVVEDEERNETYLGPR